MLRLLAVLGLALSSLVVAQCGGGAGTSPSSPSSQGTPGGGGTPAPIPAGNSLSLTPSSIQGQGQPQAVVGLASAAPSGGTVVSVTSSNPTVAKVPSAITVAAGSRSASFLVDTSTTVTIAASYAGTSMSSTLTVTPPPISAAFVVSSPTRGLGACVMADSTAEFDCLLDGSGSTGPVIAWIWTYTVGADQLGHTSIDPGSHPQISTKCAFLKTGTGGDDPNGDKYLKMEVTLQVQDRGGVRSAIVRQPVKLFPNRQCGFNY